MPKRSLAIRTEAVYTTAAKVTNAINEVMDMTDLDSGEVIAVYQTVSKRLSDYADTLLVLGIDRLNDAEVPDA